MNASTTVAFIGLGHMGGPMAANLVKAGFRVNAFDLSATALDKARADGASVAASAVEAVRGAQVVVSMLPASRHVEGLYLGEQGLLAAIEPGALVIDSSTIAPASARKVAEAAAARGLAMIDAPVSGGTAGAAAGAARQIAHPKACGRQRRPGRSQAGVHAHRALEVDRRSLPAAVLQMQPGALQPRARVSVAGGCVEHRLESPRRRARSSGRL